jgi:hypothetical protein
LNIFQENVSKLWPCVQLRLETKLFPKKTSFFETKTQKYF